MVSRPKLLIMTDSVSLPRKTETGIVMWENTYINRLKKTILNYEIISIAIGGATIKDLRNQVNYYKILNPEVVILQCGIVDATPRAFGKIEMELIKKMKLFRFTKPLVGFLRKYRAHNYTTQKKFKFFLVELKSELNPKYFISLGILPSNDMYEKKVSGITKNILKYNEILENNSIYIDMSIIPKDGILDDHHHINEEGHRFIYKELKNKLNQCGIRV